MSGSDTTLRTEPARSVRRPERFGRARGLPGVTTAIVSDRTGKAGDRIAGPRMTYARARLWLGISCVGTVVSLSATALIADAPARLFETSRGSIAGDLRALAAFVGTYLLLQLPFDVLGGRVLPHRFRRQHPSWPALVAALLRGSIVHGLALLAALLLVHAGARLFGAPGAVAAVGVSMLVLLAGRIPLARMMGGVRDDDAVTTREHGIATRFVRSDDEGFTGGVHGVFRPRVSLVPAVWAREIGEAGLDLVARRRALAVATGAWHRGRVAALAFVLAGATLAAALVGAGRHGSAAGTVELSLWFTLWSFVGLLLLPTPSRAAVRAVDRALADSSIDAASRATAAESLRRIDRLGDDEPARGRGIESVFHPIPSVEHRITGASNASLMPAWWDVARTALYAGTAAGGLLGRAVHCNCGRPALWVFLPSA